MKRNGGIFVPLSELGQREGKCDMGYLVSRPPTLTFSMAQGWAIDEGVGKCDK